MSGFNGEQAAVFPEFEASFFEFAAFSLEEPVDGGVLAALDDHFDCFSGDFGLFDAADYADRVSVDAEVGFGEFFDDFSGFAFLADDASFDSFDV